MLSSNFSFDSSFIRVDIGGIPETRRQRHSPPLLNNSTNRIVDPIAALKVNIGMRGRASGRFHAHAQVSV